MNVKLDPVHTTMLKELLKKWRLKTEQYFEEKIQEDYANAFGGKKK